jgi:hypothetical protein
MSSLDQQQIKDAIRYSAGVGINNKNGKNYFGSSNNLGIDTIAGSLTKRSRNIFKNVNRLRWRGKHQRHNSTGTAPTTHHNRISKRITSTTVTTGLDEPSMPADTISLVSNHFVLHIFKICDK